MKKLFSEIPCIESEDIVLKKIELKHISALRELVNDNKAYRYLPTFLYEKSSDDLVQVIGGLYTECFRQSIILGIFRNDEFCGIAEMYGYREEVGKISVGYRLISRYWGQGIATKTLGMMIGYLLNETDIDIITASTMVENTASARVLEKNGFIKVSSGYKEDWGYEEEVAVDKWVLYTTVKKKDGLTAVFLNCLGY